MGNHDAAYPRTHYAHDVLDRVHEEHVYVTFKDSGRTLLWEFDLLGDPEQSADGPLPPVIHLECPLCTTPDNPENRSFLSVTAPNKDFEIELIPEEQRVYYVVPQGGEIYERREPPPKETLPPGTKVCVSKKRLSIKQPIGCSYCGARFMLRDNVLSVLSR